MFEFIKKNKLIFIVISLLIVLIVVVSLLDHKKSSGINTGQSLSQQQIVDNATSDDTSESLNALTQELHHVENSNQQLQALNAKLNKKNAGILNNIKGEVQQNLEDELQKRGQDYKTKVVELQQQLQHINDMLEKFSQRQSGGAGGAYPVDKQLAHSQVVNVNGQNLVAIPDISGYTVNRNRNSNAISNKNSDSILHPYGNDNSLTKGKAKPVPYYTIPSGATLARSVNMTALIGRVPVNGVVKSPYPFKMIIDGDNMAANGLYIPGVNGAIIQGYTVGDMALSCVKGYITAITFVFPDGTISTASISNSSSNGNLGFSNSLGYISEPNGNPCFSGRFYTNAPQYLATMISLGALNQGGQAYSLAQQTSMTNAFGGATTSLTGSVGKYMLGGAVQGATQQAMDWFTAREKNSFDVVYVPAGEKAVINITKQININYNPNGRKIYYYEHKNNRNNISLD